MKNGDAITPRDLFAAAALAGIMANPEAGKETDGPTTWQWAFQLADAMMHQRKQPPSYIGEDGWVHFPEEDSNE